MKAVMVMFDTLNRHMLPPYGCDWTHAPNFARLARHSVVFDNAYVGSMPCMPARRELHTGRYNFLHRSWGPLEPYDDSTPALLRDNGVYTHLTSDHYHYWEDGGANYHNCYNTWECHRGQEGDRWMGQVAEPEPPDCVAHRPDTDPMWRYDWVNRQFMTEVKDQPQARTMASGLEFIQRNHAQDNWFLHIETFDPHEPYYTHECFKKLYPHDYDGRHFDWPPYRRVEETPDEVGHIRLEYAALLSMCDYYLGQILNIFDALQMWDDTMLIVCTDHGFLMGEHDWWAKCVQPFYQEIAHTPLFIWDPHARKRNERRQSLVQMIDLPATLLEFFGVDLPDDMRGKPLQQTIRNDASVREGALFGIFGGHINVTDGRHVYMRAADNDENAPLFEYTHMPAHMRGPFSVEEMRGMTLGPAFSFTKGCPTMKIPSRGGAGRWAQKEGTLLFDVVEDPQQQKPLDDPQVEARMVDLMTELMAENDAPAEQYQRMGIPAPAAAGKGD